MPTAEALLLLPFCPRWSQCADVCPNCLRLPAHTVWHTLLQMEAPVMHRPPTGSSSGIGGNGGALLLQLNTTTQVCWPLASSHGRPLACPCCPRECAARLTPPPCWAPLTCTGSCRPRGSLPAPQSQRLHRRMEAASGGAPRAHQLAAAGQHRAARARRASSASSRRSSRCAGEGVVAPPWVPDHMRLLSISSAGGLAACVAGQEVAVPLRASQNLPSDLAVRGLRMVGAQIQPVHLHG
jgi:hypothetical protein